MKKKIYLLTTALHNFAKKVEVRYFKKRKIEAINFENSYKEKNK